MDGNYPDFSPVMSAVCTTPSVDQSPVLSDVQNAATIAATITNSSYQSELIQVLQTYNYGIFVTDNNMVITSENIAVDSSGIQYGINNDGGILTLDKIPISGVPSSASSVGTIAIDGSDSVDYNNRYTSIDTKVYHEDGSDISFIRIIDVTTRANVFPNYDYYPAPGITNTKFKQFVLMQMSIPDLEKMQVVETNKDYQLLFFDRKPQILQISGILKNTVDNPWSMNMIFLWDNLMRGTKLVELGNICQIYIDGELFEGYPFSFNRSKAAGSDNVVSFSFGFIVKSRIAINTVASPLVSLLASNTTGLSNAATVN